MPTNCICYDPKIDALIYQSKATLEGLSDKIVKSKFYGYSITHDAWTRVDLLQNYLRVLEDENRKLALGGSPCLSSYKLQSLAEKVRGLTTTCDINGRKDLIKEDDPITKNSWIAQNPYCVSRERWEKIAYIICDAFNLQINIVEDTEDCKLDMEVLSVEEVCDITFEIVRNLIPCDIIVALSVYHEMCDLDLNITRTLDESELDCNILVNDLQIDLDQQLYRELVSANISFDIIKTVYENGCSFNINNGDVELVTPMSAHSLSKLKFKGDPDIKTLTELGIEMEGSKFIEDSQIFIEKLKQDYGE